MVFKVKPRHVRYGTELGVYCGHPGTTMHDDKLLSLHLGIRFWSPLKHTVDDPKL